MEATDPSLQVRLADRAAYFPPADTLVCADLHLGRDRTAQVEFPLGERTRVPERLNTLLDQFDPGTVVFAGDLLHTFDHLPAGVEDTLGELLDLVDRAGATPVLLTGNHDSMLASIAPTSIAESYRLADDTLVVHGHAAPDAGVLQNVSRVVIGHVHPAIVIEGQRRPCYLYNPDTDPSVFVVPAFTTLAPGTPVNEGTGDLPSPLISRLDAFRPAVWDPAADETLWFPPLRRLRSIL